VWAAAVPASAAIIDTDAVVSTTVQELIDGVPASVTNDSEQHEADAPVLPLVASGDLLSTDLDGVLVARGQALSEFSDPTRLDEPNPEEFALEVASFSSADSVSYSVTSLAEEARTVVFTTSGSALAPPEIDFGTASTQRVESRIFLSGAVIFWSTEPGRELDDMLSEFRVTVTREDSGDKLFETTLTIDGGETDRLRRGSTGPIRSEVVNLNDLRDEGVDEGTISILARVENEGTLIVVVIPPQEHSYTYTVTANEPLVLRAEFSTRVQNIPDGTGIAATLGRPFENLVDFIEEGLPGVDGRALQRSINAAVNARAIGLVTPPRSSAGWPADNLCGALGFGSAALYGLAFFVMLGRSRR
jgi:hypothetical protein